MQVIFAKFSSNPLCWNLIVEVHNNGCAMLTVLIVLAHSKCPNYTVRQTGCAKRTATFAETNYEALHRVYWSAWADIPTHSICKGDAMCWYHFRFWLGMEADILPHLFSWTPYKTTSSQSRAHCKQSKNFDVQEQRKQKIVSLCVN